MSDIKLNDSAPVAQPHYADGESLDNTSNQTQRQEGAAANTPAALMRQYLSQLTSQQGRLPDEVAQKQQALLRLLSSQLENSGQSSGSNPENQPLQQLLQRLLPLLRPQDPLLNQQVMTLDKVPVLLRQLAATPSLVTTLMQQLPLSLQESSSSGRALMQWLVQSIALRVPAEQINRNLVSALTQQQIVLPSAEIDKRQMMNLDQLSRATLQFLLQSQLSTKSTIPQPGTTTPGSTTHSPGSNSSQATGPGEPLPEEQPSGQSEASHAGSKTPPTASPARMPLLGVNLPPATTKGIALPTQGDKTAPPPTQTAPAAPSQGAVKPANDGGRLLEALSLVSQKAESVPLLQRMGALLQGHTAVSQSQQPMVNALGSPPIMPLPMPLGAFIFEIGQQLGARRLPDLLRPSLQRLYDALQSPLQQSNEVEQWFDFLQQPLSSSSSTGRALQQWALTLFSIRLQQLQAEADETNPRKEQPTNPLLTEEHKQLTEKMAASLLGQTERFKQLHQEMQQPLPNYVPLPPQQPGGRESGLSMQRSPGKHNPYQWTLSFYLEPPQLGAIQIRARLDIPDIQLQVMAERLTTVDRVRETLPLLEGRFRELGLQPSQFGCRQGKVNPPTDEPGGNDEPSSGLSIRI